MNEQKEREAFEAKLASLGLMSDKLESGKYVFAGTRIAWQLWLARAEIAERDRLDAERFRILRSAWWNYEPWVNKLIFAIRGMSEEEFYVAINTAIKENGNE